MRIEVNEGQGQREIKMMGCREIRKKWTQEGLRNAAEAAERARRYEKKKVQGKLSPMQTPYWLASLGLLVFGSFCCFWYFWLSCVYVVWGGGHLESLSAMLFFAVLSSPIFILMSIIISKFLIDRRLEMPSNPLLDEIAVSTHHPGAIGVVIFLVIVTPILPIVLFLKRSIETLCRVIGKGDC